MSVKNIPLNLLEHEDDFQEFTIPDWKIPTKEQLQQYVTQSLKWSDDDVDGQFVQELIVELEKQKQAEAQK